MAWSLQLRTLSGRGASTSSSSHIECRPASYLVVRAERDTSRQSAASLKEGWLGNACYLHRRPSFPKSSSFTASEVASLDNAFTTRKNGKSFKIYETTEFVAETLLPTAHGKYRVRAYRHSVSCLLARASAHISPRASWLGSFLTAALLRETGCSSRVSQSIIHLAVALSVYTWPTLCTPISL